jgi:type I restriction enzyme M protein
MVAVIDPQKNEVIIDPACGTAGFLISSYRHIIKANTKKVPGDLLTTGERKKLLNNFRGYDISPDMVRLSLVNLYLHGFSQPKLYEYDTLTSDERWNEYGDVLLANPPFMSPKGGIKPHKRFSVQSSRSEVLFVDYIAEHLTTSGRAAVIVPEGIIFQSGTAYKQLRKSLVEKYLYAVVSLPAGVFNPYSGVKTSILFFEPLLAQKSDSILFVKIENDGFSLGAQRRAIDRNDLPEAAKIMGEFRKQITNRKKGYTVTLPASTVGNLIVSKKKFVANGEYNLSGERYRERDVRISKFPLIPLGELCELIGGSTPSKQNESYWTNGTIKWISSKHIDERGNINGYELISQSAIDERSTRIAPKGSTIVITRVSVGKFAFADDDYAINQDLTALVSRDSERLAPKFIRVISYHIASIVEQKAEGIGVRGVTRNFLAELQIPLPPIEVQQKIVTKIENYQRIIDGARQVVDNWKPHIDVDPDWPMVKLGDVCDDFKNGLNFSSDQVGRGTKFVNIKDIFSDGYVDISNLERVEISRKEKLSKLVSNNDLLFVRSSVKYEGVGFPSLIVTGDEEIVFCGFLIKCTPKEAIVVPEYLLYLLRTDEYRGNTIALSNKANITNISQESLKSLDVPLPPIETQRAIVADIEAERALVAANRELIARMEKKIQAVIARVWGTE